jgi:hypothetical protein
MWIQPDPRELQRVIRATSEVERNQALFPDPRYPARPRMARAIEDLPAPVEPYSTIVEAVCDDCGGDGRNHDLDDDYEPCEHCVDGTVYVLRNWLGEALQIADGHLNVDLRREHVIALSHYAASGQVVVGPLREVA